MEACFVRRESGGHEEKKTSEGLADLHLRDVWWSRNGHDLP